MPNDDDEKKAARAARVAADMRETEDLLAGFDRPGRTPRTPPVRDFVDYHMMKKERSDPNAAAGGRARDAAAALAAAGAPKRVPEPTFVIPRQKSNHVRLWFVWLGLLLAMPTAGGLVAYCTLSADKTATPSSLSTSIPSAATTISAASSPMLGAERDIPPPPPLSSLEAVPNPSTLSPSSSFSSVSSTNTPPQPSSSSSSPAPATARPSSNGQPGQPGQPASSSSSDPRVDFIRHL